MSSGANLNFHENYSSAGEVKKSSDRTFGFVFVVFFCVIGLLPLVVGADVRLWSLALAALLLVITLIRPGLFAPLNRIWLKFGRFLGEKFTEPLLMAVIFYGAVTPVGMVSRWVRRDAFRLRIDSKSETYWIRRNSDSEIQSSMKNQF